jgi:hypothetical protein
MSEITMKKEDEIQPRKTGDDVPDLFTVDPALGQYQFGDLAKYVEFSKLMCQAGEMLPKHAQKNPAICLALTMRAVHWGFDPFALALESYQAGGSGPVGYMAKVFTAVIRKAGITLNYRYEGELIILDKPVKSYKGNEVAKRTATGNRKCIAYAEIGGHLLEYETPELDQITIKNSPLWHNDPNQQLAYYAGRGWARRHRSDLMMGAYSQDEIQDMRAMRDVTPKPSGFAQLGDNARNKAASAPKEEDAIPSTQKETKDEPTDDTADDAAIEGDLIKDDVAEDQPETEIDPTSPAFGMGAEAAGEDFIGRDQGPFKANEESDVEHANWLAGFDSIERKTDGGE